MHAVCRLLSYDGYYEFAGTAMPTAYSHYKLSSPSGPRGGEQEELLKKKAIQCFDELEAENGGLEEAGRGGYPSSVGIAAAGVVYGVQVPSSGIGLCNGARSTAWLSNVRRIAGVELCCWF